MPQAKDATWLFERCKRSEQWWTSLASMLFIHLALKDHAPPVPIWRYDTNPENWRFYQSGDTLTLTDLRPSSVMVERTLKSDIFPGIQSWPLELNTTPDLLLHWRDARRLVIIENKTEGAGVGSIREYWKAVQYLRQKGWQAHLLLLISCGHPNNSIWNVVKELQVELLLWEDLLNIADHLDWSRSLFDEDLKPYYDQPLLQSEWGLSKGG
jgi:hypothetical protein